MKKIREIRPGVLNEKQISDLVEANMVINVEESSVDGSSFDLHLSSEGWEMRGSMKPSVDMTCDAIKDECKRKKLDLDVLTTLEVSKTYMIQIKERLNLQKKLDFHGIATGKSSIGRLDVLTRLMVDRWHCYDEVRADYDGSLYLEVTPITFPITVKKGVALSQLRLFRGHPDISQIDEKQIHLFGELLLDENGRVKTESIPQLTVNLSPDTNGVSAFCARKKSKKNRQLEIDVTKKAGTYHPKRFWTGITVSPGDQLKIKPEKFYILRSKERFRLPDDVAVYCQAISENLGELRIHYAGFVHPRFGRKKRRGTPIIFEVRGHNVTTYLRHGETLANIKFYRMSKPAKGKPSAYGKQELKLSKYFKDWDAS